MKYLPDPETFDGNKYPVFHAGSAIKYLTKEEILNGEATYLRYVNWYVLVQEINPIKTIKSLGRVKRKSKHWSAIKGYSISCPNCDKIIWHNAEGSEYFRDQWPEYNAYRCNADGGCNKYWITPNMTFAELYDLIKSQPNGVYDK